MKKMSIITLFSIITIVVFSQFIMIMSSKNTETSEYKVLEKFEKFEIRKYPELFVATTKMSESNYEKSSSKGFRTVANFIFGGNDENKKIAMTSPVIMDMSDSIEMSFIMPNNINQTNAPNPNNKDVILQKRETQTVAVIRFGGWANDNKIKQKEKELIELLKANNISYSGNCTYLGYNPPYQITNRRNEVTIKVNYENL